jgi:pyruvate/2-oxoglutarate dehydrogenase complex dihydrolipoamide acyltransferase (E2) component
LRASLRRDGRRLTALAFHVAVLARCLREHPRFNASLSSDGERLIFKNCVHIGIAVDTPHGLIVPVIRNADQLRLGEIGEAITDLAGRAQERRIRPAELGGASMSISNLGGIGGEAFTPIVNPPELAILGIMRTEMRPVWDGTAFQPRPMVPLDLTYDHRVLNGADAARFLARYRALFAAPEELLLAQDGSLMKDL